VLLGGLKWKAQWASLAVGMAGQEGELFRRVVGWSVMLLLLMCVLVYLQSTSVLSWMVV
jgi:lactate permease